MTDETYNGWTNRETWQVNLWLANDQGLYNVAREMAREPDPEDALRQFVETETDSAIDQMTPAGGMAGDLIGAALARVDWRGIVAAFTED